MRDQYVHMRRTGQMDLGWFYQYYTQHRDPSKIELPFDIFVQTFRMYFQIYGQDVLHTLDVKFTVQKIVDNNDNILYIN